MTPKGHVPKFIFAHPANQRPTQTLLSSGSNSASGLGLPLSSFQVTPAKSSRTWKASISPSFWFATGPCYVYVSEAASRRHVSQAGLELNSASGFMLPHLTRMCPIPILLRCLLDYPRHHAWHLGAGLHRAVYGIWVRASMIKSSHVLGRRGSLLGLPFCLYF